MNDANAPQALLEKLASLMSREPSLSGKALEEAVNEKETLVRELEGVIASFAGNPVDAQDLRDSLAAAAFANGGSIRWNRLRQKLAELGQRERKSPPTSRVDLIS